MRELNFTEEFMDLLSNNVIVAMHGGFSQIGIKDPKTGECLARIIIVPNQIPTSTPKNKKLEIVKCGSQEKN